MTIHSRGGRMHERGMAEKIVSWCIRRLELHEVHPLHVEILIKKMNEDSGYCEPLQDDNSYKLTIANNQSLRDFVMTVIHEMVHVNQYIRDDCKDPTDGDYDTLPSEK